MDKQNFIEKIPFLYHLTDKANIPIIISSGRLYSTVELVANSDISDKDRFLNTRRAEHAKLKINDNEINIRDQRPLNRALERCLTGGWTPEQFIFHLNKRVFLWPNLKRLNIHYSRYQHESPAILRFSSKDILSINSNPQLSMINSGATRPSGTLGGKAAARGKDTFVDLQSFGFPASKIAEVTFEEFCLLPTEFEIGQSPDGPWSKIRLLLQN